MQKLLLLLNILPFSIAFSQCMSTGNGSDGIFHATANTIIPSGVYNFSSFIIDQGVTVSASGTLPLEIYITGSATINGTLTVSGANGVNGITWSNGGSGGIGVAGGGNGGNGSFDAFNGPLDGTDGMGTGGLNNKGAGWSGGGGAGYSAPGMSSGSSSGGFSGISYGDAQITVLTAGSGGGGGSGGNNCGAGGGGAGGGLIVLQANDIVISSTGSIYSNGGNGGSDGTGNCGAGGGGSGGSLIIGAINTFTNDGVISAQGGIGGASNISGSPYYGTGGNGANGRIKLSTNVIGSGVISPNADGQLSTGIQITSVSINGTCSELNQGSAVLNVTGGVSPYSFTWLESGENSSNPTLLPSGINNVTITDAAGCSIMESVLVPEFTSYQMDQSITLCSGETITIGNNSYSETGIFTDILSTINGCDSTIITNLVVNSSIVTSQDFNLCFGESVSVGDNVYSNSGTFTDILSASNGCDSTIISNIVVQNAFNPSVTLTNTTLTADQNGVVYQWIDCESQNPIANATSQSFTPEITGNYAVILTLNSCTETSECTIVDFTSIEELGNFGKIHPNPTYGSITISFETETDKAIITLYNPSGQVVKTEKIVNSSAYKIDLSEHTSGIYFISIEMDGLIHYAKISKL